jgi:hypothetical protein
VGLIYLGARRPKLGEPVLDDDGAARLGLPFVLASEETPIGR